MSRWNAVYRAMPPAERDAVNDLVNGIFRERTGFTGKIDPKTHPQFADQWLAIRDSVLANREQFAALIQKSVRGVQEILRATALYQMFTNVPAWIQTARSQIGQHEIAGSTHNQQIMAYIWTCTNIQETEAQKKYVAREGEEGVEWCSAFVNWCLKQAGITGTNNALASSWQNWGTKLDGPKPGAICGFNWNGGSRIDHVGFCDQVDNEWRLLGGNQTDANSGGIVSSVRFPKANCKYYRWPEGA
ncbi:MAG TPA: TIGR02594 family protein [Caulifigura sp.]|nr:TIGR02594 family protein [Caulifigura sp.]